MEVTPPTTVMPPIAGAAAGMSAESANKPAKIASDFETFLSLLTAQLSNQDPLEPMKSEEFAAQLATFSMVEQQTYSNQLLETMLSQTGSDSFASMSAWVDREVKAQMPARYTGAPITVDPDVPVAGNRHELVVTNVNGQIVDRVSIGETGDQLSWTGLYRDGTQAPAGLYSFAVESFDKGHLVASAPAATYATVTEVRQTRDGPVLAFDGGVTVAASDVTAIRLPS